MALLFKILLVRSVSIRRRGLSGGGIGMVERPALAGFYLAGGIDGLRSA